VAAASTAMRTVRSCANSGSPPGRLPGSKRGWATPRRRSRLAAQSSAARTSRNSFNNQIPCRTSGSSEPPCPRSPAAAACGGSRTPITQSATAPALTPRSIPAPAWFRVAATARLSVTQRPFHLKPRRSWEGTSRSVATLQHPGRPNGSLPPSALGDWGLRERPRQVRASERRSARKGRYHDAFSRHAGVTTWQGSVPAALAGAA